MHQHLKQIITESFIDSKNRLSSPKLKDSYINKICPELIELKTQYGISYSQLFHHIVNNIPLHSNVCEFCNKPTKYISFFIGYNKTCHEKDCLMKSYGKNPPILSAEIRKRLSTRMKINNPMFDPEIVKKSHHTTLQRYGTEPYHSPETKIKSLNSRFDLYQTFSPKSPLYATKDYTMPSGVIVKLQGYEPFAIDHLLLTYDETDIIICGKTYSFNYTYKNKTRKYYPDIYIPKDKLFIEVKSPYTYNISLEINMLKHATVLDNGFGHHFYIFTKNSNKTKLEILH